jgi:hypothetical protein
MQAIGRLVIVGMTVLVLGGLDAAPAGAVTIDFDAFADLETVTTQVPGLTFTNATVLTAGISLNELEFPPRSDANVVFDDGGALAIVFDTPQASAGGYVTYLGPLTLTAYDAVGDVLGSITSAFGSNLALSGDAGSAPNELLQLAFSGGISRIVFAGDAVGGSFTLDDLTFQPRAAAVPAPSSLLLMVGVVLAAAAARRRARRAGCCAGTPTGAR